MQNAEWEHSLEWKKAEVLKQYVEILKEKGFFVCSTLDEFALRFSSLFSVYQDVTQRKMDPDSIRDGQVSCSSAAALLGVWWEQQSAFPAIFLIQDVKRIGQPRTSAHVGVAVSMEHIIGSHEAQQAFFDPSRKRPDIRLFDWTEYSKMKPINPQNTYNIYTIEGVENYIKDRIRLFGLPKKYSSKVRGADTGIR